MALTLSGGSVTSLLGQTATGTIIGHITDSSGSLLPGVDVIALNPAKGITKRTVSDEQGIYRLFYMDPATYKLTFQKSGFATLERDGLALRSNDTLAVDIQMNVGSVVERVEVSTAAPLLETATSTTGTVLAGSQMNALPIMQRYTWMTMYMMPGVTSMNGFHIAGQRDRGLGYSMDGISGTEPVRGGVATNRIMSTTQNAIQEVKMVTTVLPAEDGHSAGGLLSATYKSGTNQLHVESEDRYVSNPMLHRAYFNLGNAPFAYHELADLVSGPVIFPKLYNGKNRTFFLFGWSRHNEVYDQSVFADVPTPDMLNGDFSFNGLGYPIFDPTTTRQDSSGKWIRDPFPGNIVPKSRFDPAVVNFLGHQPWEAPNNLGGSGFIDKLGPHLNYGDNSHYTSFRTRWDIKIDHNISDKNRLFGRYSWVQNRAHGNQIGLNWTMLDGNYVLAPADQINGVISDTHVFNPTLINEVRLGVNHRKESRNPPGVNENWAQQLGIPGVSGATFPSFFNSGGGAFYNATFPGAPYYQVDENYTVQENLTKVVSRHTLKMGYELLRTRANVFSQSQPGGIFRFGGTDMPFTPNTGNDFAAFLLGSVVRADFNTYLANWLPRWWSHALYFQDDWTVNQKLTFNLGLRWSYETPFQTKYGQQSQFDPNATDPVSGLKGAITHPSGPLGRSNYKHFQPRIGMAYKFADKMVFRGGFGVTTVDLFTTDFNQNFEEYSTAVSVQRPTGDPRPAFFLSQGPGPVNFNILSNGTSPFVGVNYSARQATRYDPALHNPYAMNWNATIQYQFAPSWLLELSYQGSSGVGLLNAWDTNTVPLNISTDPTVLNNIFQNYQNFRPFPNFGSIYMWSNFSHSTYHSGTVKVEKRSSYGLMLTSFYTWSKAIDECDADGICSGETYYNRKLEKGIAGFNLTNRNVTYLTYELPFGRGRHFMNSGGVKDYILGGWNASIIQTFQTGLPVTFTLAGSPYRYLPGNGVQRPTQILPTDQLLVANYRIGDRFNNSLKNPMWNINAFANPAAFTLGTLGRNTITGPSMNWTQVSLAKNFAIKEKYNFEVRYDINNVFKQPNFINPSSVVNLASPGLFGKPTGTQGGWCCLGGQFVSTLVLKFQF
ncbi:MAG TPA: carboxypeptidase regulatory-like domain-containing protein [Bryobacteraceae bacterium]|nr:carboxypeptidase regulatory-like domain-containing protein [Bryobacteraceae bacterium]